LGLDRFPGGHDRGSSHGETRIIRQAYFEHADYVPLLRRAYELWAELESLADEQLFHRVGLLQIGPPEGYVIGGVLTAARQHGLKVDELSAAQSQARFPGFHVPEGMVGVFEPAAGYLRVERCVLAHLAAAKQQGAELRSGVTVQSWNADDGGVAVTTDQGNFTADKLVITAGAWAPHLLASLGIPMTVRRKHLHWFACDHPVYRGEQAPTFFYELPHGLFYGFPAVDELGVKVAEHSGGETVTDPLTDPRPLEELDLARVRDFVGNELPAVGKTARHTNHKVCFYTMSPDEHFIVDTHPRHKNVAFCAGLSGHGFKFTSVLGEVMADIALTGTTAQPIGFLGTRRFR
ncbi:MAG: N-methyl-L-tryptophan oxidase, partial [Planctomycetales bacterium]|nr:N-methyl-L-tryptophan oxidase [Planctomycetales bacterium]